MCSNELGGQPDATPTQGALRLGDAYVAAWAEVDFRIAQRQNALQIYVTLATALIAVMFTGQALNTSGLGPQWFSLLLPAISLVFVALNHKHERTIGLLRKYLLECEQSVPSVHGYHRMHYVHALPFRRRHDWAAAVLIVIFNVLGFFVARANFHESFGWLGWPTFVYLFVTGWAARSILNAAKSDEVAFEAALKSPPP